MKNSLMVLATILACSTSIAFAGNKNVKTGQSPKSEHELTVGSEKAADSGNTADDKTVKEMVGQSPKNEHELTVGNEKASDSGSTADDKTVKEEKAHSNKGKAKGQAKK